MHFLQNKRNGILLLSLIWLVIYLLIRPFHEFPLNDDWSYAMTVKFLVEDGKYILQDWLAGPMLTQLFWGALFCLPSGFSFAALTLSTLVLSLTGVIFTYLLLFITSKNPATAFLAGLLVAVNPLYISLSVTFMTDIHFYAFFIVSLFAFVKFDQTGKTKFWLLGFLMALLATFIRQFGLVVPLAFLIRQIIADRSFFTKKAVYYFISFSAIFILYFVYSWYLKHSGQLPENYRTVSDVFDQGIENLAWSVFTRTGMILLESGFWLLPIVAWAFVSEFKNFKAPLKIIIPVVLILLIPLIRTVGELPVGNIMYDLGLGIQTTRDLYFDAQNARIFSLPYVWHIIRPLAFIGALMLISLLAYRSVSIVRGISSSETSETEVSGLVPILIFLLYTGILMINFTYFDRYLIPLIPVFILWMLPVDANKPVVQKFFLPASIIFLIILATFSILATRQYLQWNEAKWQMAEELIESGVMADKIDGGHEFNGWHGAKIFTDGSWPTDSYEYIIVFNEMPGFKTVKKNELKNFFSSRQPALYLQKKIP